MLKKATVAAVLLLVLALGLRTGVRRLTRDGSGFWPMLVSSAPNYDALEADRARQRENAPLPAAGNPAAASASGGPVVAPSAAAESSADGRAEARPARTTD